MGVSTRRMLPAFAKKRNKQGDGGPQCVPFLSIITLVKIPIKIKGIKRPSGPSCTLCPSPSIMQWVQGKRFRTEMLRCDIKWRFFSGMHRKSVIGSLISSLMLPPSYLTSFQKMLWFGIMCQVVVWHRSRGLIARNTV